MSALLWYQFGSVFISMTEECNLKLYSSVQEMKESTSLQYLFYGFSFQPKSFRVFFLFGNTFLRQRLSCQSTCQHFSLVRGIISQLCHKHFLLYQALYSNIPFYRQLLLKPVSLWLPKQNTFFLWHKTCSLKLAEKNEQWISADVTTELRSVLNWQSARPIQIGLP